MYSVLKTVKSRIQDKIITAMESLVLPTVVLAIKSAGTSSGRSLDGNVLELGQRVFQEISENPN